MNQKKLYKVRNGKLFGICGGFAEYFDLDPTLVRVLMVLFGLVGAGVIAYIVMYFIMPYKDELGL